MLSLQNAASHVLALALLIVVPLVAQSADKFPTKPVRIIVGFSPGSATDITARLVGPKLSDLWGQPVVIENRSGAGGMFATASVAQSVPDGHTLLMISTSFAITATIQKNLPYDARKDFRGVTQIGTPTGVVSVAPSLGVKSLKELIALVKERPGKILYGSTGAGSGSHMSTERFAMVAGIRPVHVAFKGQPELIIEVVTGRVNFGIPSLGPVMPFIKDGRLMPLAVNTQKRSPHLPDVPTILEILPQFERDSTHGFMAHSRTPTAIVRQISRDVARVLELPDVKEKMYAMSFDPAPTTPEEYDEIIRKQLETFARVAKAVGLVQ